MINYFLNISFNFCSFFISSCHFFFHFLFIFSFRRSRKGTGNERFHVTTPRDALPGNAGRSAPCGLGFAAPIKRRFAWRAEQIRRRKGLANRTRNRGELARENWNAEKVQMQIGVTPLSGARRGPAVRHAQSMVHLMATRSIKRSPSLARTNNNLRAYWNKVEENAHALYAMRGTVFLQLCLVPSLKRSEPKVRTRKWRTPFFTLRPHLTHAILSPCMEFSID